MKTAYFTDRSRRLVRASNFSGRIMKAGSLNDYTGLVTTQLGVTVAQCLRYCARNQKVTGSIAAGVNGIFH